MMSLALEKEVALLQFAQLQTRLQASTLSATKSVMADQRALQYSTILD